MSEASYKSRGGWLMVSFSQGDGGEEDWDSSLGFLPAALLCTLGPCLEFQVNSWRGAPPCGHMKNEQIAERVGHKLTTKQQKHSGQIFEVPLICQVLRQNEFR